MINDFPSGGSINREYTVNIPSGTYTATLRLHYEDAELNGNDEARLDFWKNSASSWAAASKTTYNATNNYVELSAINSINARWTLSDDNAIVAWNGSVNSDWNTAANWTVINGSANTPPKSTDIVQLGGINYTNAPIISNNAGVKNK